MKLTIHLGWLLVLAYIIAGFATFGYSYNHTAWSDEGYIRGNQVIGTLFSSICWPIYWGGTIAIQVMK